MKNGEKLLYLISGANGSGKSTLANVLSKESSPYAIDKVPIYAEKVYFKRLKEFFDANKSFAIETTLSCFIMVMIMRQRL